MFLSFKHSVSSYICLALVSTPKNKGCYVLLSNELRIPFMYYCNSTLLTLYEKKKKTRKNLGVLS